jgi:hypothetical protein
MRTRAGLIPCLLICGLSGAFAAEPPGQAAPAGPADPAAATPAPSESIPAPTTGDAGHASASEPKTSAATAGSAPLPAPSQATAPAAASKSGKPELTPEEHRLVNQGYKLEMHNGQKIFCRREQELGSRVSPIKTCGTAEQLKFVIQQNKDELRSLQFKSDMPSKP